MKKIESIMMYVIYAAVALIGVEASFVMLWQKYSDEKVNAFIILAAISVGIAFSLGIYFYGRYTTALSMIFYCAGIIIILLNFVKVYGGIAYVMNNIMDAVSMYYGLDVSYLDITEQMQSVADGRFAAALISAVLGFAYMNIFLYKRNGFPAILIVLICYFFPATLENTPGIGYFLMDAVFICFMTANMGEVLENTVSNNRLYLIVTSIMLVVCVLTFLIVNIVKPAAEYRLSEAQSSLKGKYVFTVEDMRVYFMDNRQSIFNFNTKKANEISGGALDDNNNFSYYNEPVFYVRLPQDAGRQYFRAYAAAKYSSEEWTRLPGNVYSAAGGLFESGYNAGFYPQNSTAYAIHALAQQGTKEIRAYEYDILLMKLDGDKYSYISPNTVILDGKSISSSSASGLVSVENEQVLEFTENSIGKEHILHSMHVTEWNPQMSYMSLYKLGEKIKSGTYSVGEEVKKAEENYRNFVYSNYLEVNMPDAERINEELIPAIKSSDYSLEDAKGKAQFIYDLQLYFQRNYKYSTNPGKVPSGKDFAGYFLFESKKGFCTYFATAGVMILRSAGIPARYAEGYILPENLYDKSRIVDMEFNTDSYQSGQQHTESKEYVEIQITDKYAHAWAEVYIDGLGWVTVECTPGYETQVQSEEETSEEETTQEESTEEETTTESTPEETITESDTETNSESEIQTRESDTQNTIEEYSSGMTGEYGTDDEGDNGQADRKDVFAGIFKTILKILGIILIPVIIVVLFLLRKKYIEQNRNKLYNEGCGIGRTVRVERMLRYFERLTAFAGYKMAADEEYRDFLNRCNFTGDLSQAAKTAGIIERFIYSRNEPAESDALYVMAFIKTVRDGIYQNQKWYKKFIFKYIFVY